MTDSAGTDRADRIASLRAARDAIDRELALLAGEHQVDAAEWVTLGQAADFRRCTEQTMQRLAIAHGLGVKRAGRWRIDLCRVRRWQAGDGYTPLPAD